MIYIDGNVRIIGSMREYIDKELKKAPMLCLKHPERTNPYDEAEECIRLKKADPDVIRAQMKGYQEEGFKGDTGLIVANILFRSHNDPAVIRVMKRWWHEIENKSQRDQLSFNYACWKEEFTYDLSELKCWRSPYWMNPGIHTSSLKKVEEELIEHIAVQEYQQYCIREKEKALCDAKQYIALKEKELHDANDYIRIKEEELSASIQRENELRKQIDRIHSMWLWKASKPIRILYRKIRSE